MDKGEQPQQQNISGPGAFAAAGSQHFHGPVTQHHHHGGLPALTPWTPPARADGFTAREKDIIRVKDLMAAHRCVALVGPGGIGKTGIAAEVISQLAPDRDQPGEFPDGIYSHNFYGPGRGDAPADVERERRASHLGVLSALLQQHAQAQGQQAVLMEDIAGLEARVRSLFHSSRILLYLEGCEMAQDIPALLELTGPARVLLTSRYRSHIGFAEPYKVDPLPEEEGARLLHFHARGELLPGDATEQARWRKLSRELGGHALALRLAAAWMRGQKESPEEFSRSQQTGGFGDWAQQDQRRQNLHLLFAHSADAVVRKDANALEVWFALALHAHAPVPLPVLCASVGQPDAVVRKALAALVNYSLAERGEFPSEQIGKTEPAWQLTHALLEEWGRDHLGSSRREEAPIHSSKEDGASSRRLLPARAEQILRSWRAWWRQDLKRCFDNRAVPGGPARYAALQPHWESLLRVLTETESKEKCELSVEHNYIAAIHSMMGSYSLAQLLYERALAASERTLGPQHPTTLASLNNLAVLLKDKGNLVGAEPLYRRALAAQERTLGPEHPATLMSLNNLAGLLHAKGGLAEAEPLYRRALEARERTLAPEHPDTLPSLNNLAVLLMDKGDLAGAEPLYRRALAAQERTLGPEHPATLASLNNLAILLKVKGDLAGAEPLYRRALAARERTLGPEHPDTLTSLNNLANLLFSKDDLAGAEPLYRRALASQERALGPEHPATLSSLNNLASLLAAKGDLAGAEPLAERAVRGYLAKLGAEHRHTKLAQGVLAAIREQRAKDGKG